MSLSHKLKHLISRCHSADAILLNKNWPAPRAQIVQSSSTFPASGLVRRAFKPFLTAVVSSILSCKQKVYAQQNSELVRVFQCRDALCVGKWGSPSQRSNPGRRARELP